MKDEALEEIWAIRRQISDESGGYLDARYALYREEQEEFTQKGGKLITKPGVRLPEPDESTVVREDPPQ